MKIAPERLFLDAESQVYRVAGRKLKDSNIEYIRANEYTALLERHRRLVKAVREWMVIRLDNTDIDDEHSCFSECVLAKECDEDSGNECLFVARLRAALEEEG